MSQLSSKVGTAIGFTALGFLLAACGGDDTLTEAEFAQRMNEICQDNGDRFEEIGHPESFEDMVVMNPQLADAFGETLDRTGDLLIEMADAAGADDGDAFEAIVGRMGEVGMESDAIANDLGATVCTSEG